MTPNSIYKPTFLEKLLGRNYKWWYLFIFSFKSSTNYRASNLFYSLGTFVGFFGPILVWSLIDKASGYSFKEIVTYFLIGMFFKNIFVNDFFWQMSNEILNGKLNIKLLSPSGVWEQYTLRKIGSNLFFNADFLIYLLVAIIFNLTIIPSILNLFLFLILGLLVFIFTIFISVIISSFTFWFTDNDGFMQFYSEIVRFLSGSFFPLDVFSWLSFLLFLPFSYFLYHPMQIYLGKYSTNEIILVFIGGLAWCLILYFLAKLVFRLGLKRNESVGL